MYVVALSTKGHVVSTVSVISCGVTPSNDHPLLWAWLNAAWTTSAINVAAADVTMSHPVLSKLPGKVYPFLCILAERGVVTKVKLEYPESPRSPENALVLQTRPATNSISVINRLDEILTQAETFLNRQLGYPPAQDTTTVQLRWSILLGILIDAK